MYDLQETLVITGNFWNTQEERRSFTSAKKKGFVGNGIVSIQT